MGPFYSRSKRNKEMQPLEVLCEPRQNPVLEIAAVTDLGQDWDVDGELDDVME